MSRDKAESERILSEYGRRMFESHVDYFDVTDSYPAERQFISGRLNSVRRITKRALILCATLILVMSLAIGVCCALGLQIFNYKFDINDGFIVITRIDDEDGSHFYKPTYIADGYSFSEVESLDNTRRYYIYKDDANNLEYTISESTDSSEVIFIDNENYEQANEVYGSYELVVFEDRFSSLVVVYMEKEKTYISIGGHLTLDQIHSIIDSFEIDTK